MKRGYIKSEFGPIPSSWEIKRLNEIGEALIGLTYRPSDVKSSGTLVLRSSNIQNEALAFEDNVFVNSEIPERIRVRVGDVLICVRNGSRDLIGKSAFLDERVEEMTFGAFMAVYRSSIGKLASYFFQSEILKRQINEHLGATINQITNKSINSFRIPLPPTQIEQQAIATALSDIDALIDGLSKLITKKRDIKQATMQQLLAGKTRLPGFSGEWEEKTLGDVLEKIVGGGTPSRANPAYWNGEIPWVTVKDFATFNAYSAQEYISINGLKKSASNLIPAGTLITSTRMAVGKSVVYKVDVAINRDLKALYFYQTISVEFMAYWFEFHEQFISELGSGSTVKGISIGDLQRLKFNAPQYDEQTTIAQVLCDMDNEITALEKRLEKTRMLKQGMMQELLTGRIRLV